MNDCICGGTGLVTRLTETGDTGPEVCPDCFSAARPESAFVRVSMCTKDIAALLTWFDDQEISLDVENALADLEAALERERQEG